MLNINNKQRTDEQKVRRGRFALLFLVILIIGCIVLTNRKHNEIVINPSPYPEIEQIMDKTIDSLVNADSSMKICTMGISEIDFITEAYTIPEEIELIQIRIMRDTYLGIYQNDPKKCEKINDEYNPDIERLEEIVSQEKEKGIYCDTLYFRTLDIVAKKCNRDTVLHKYQFVNKRTKECYFMENDFGNDEPSISKQEIDSILTQASQTTNGSVIPTGEED